MASKYAPIGSVSSGTMICEDVFGACIDMLWELDAKRAKEIQADWDIVPQSCTFIEDDHDETICVDCQEARSIILNEDLWDALNEHAAPYCYFGAHEGDGADYGFWVSFDSLEDDVRYGEVLKVDDTSEVDEDYRGYIMLVSDHGNVTLLSRSDQGDEEVWSCV